MRVKVLGVDVHEYSERIIELKLYECKYLSGDIILSEHSDYKWVLMNEILNYDLCDGDKKIVEKLIEKFGN